MESEWKETTLGQVVKEGYGLIQTGPFGSQLHASDYKLNGVPVIMPMNISADRVDVTDIARISREDADRLSKHLVESGDIVYSRRGDVTLKALITDREAGMFCGTGCLLVRPGRCIDPKFLKYHLSSPRNQEWIVRHAVGATMPNLNTAILANIPLLVPSPSIQKAIAHILGSLDDKIELNRRMNKTLEGMAQALFKSWFVDFDPVIDNAIVAGNSIPEELADRAEVRRAALANGTVNREAAKPFPAAFQQTEELGWIPVGWDVKPLGTFLDVLETGRRPKGGVAKYTHGMPSVGAESIRGIGGFDFGQTKFVPLEFFEKMNSGKIHSHDVLLYKDGGKPGEFKPRIGMLGNGFPFEEFGINEHVFRMRSEKLGQPFLYFQTGSERVFHHLAVRGGKAAIPGINQTEVNSVDFLVPPDRVLQTFNEFGYSLINRILDSALATQSLTKLRDTLLPKLISGELRIPDAEKLAEAALA